MVNLAITAALLPALFTEDAGTGPVGVQAGDTLDTVSVVAASSGDGEVVALAPSEVAARAATTTTTAPPATTTTAAPATTTTTAPKPKPKTTTTTTAAPEPKAAPTPSAPPAEDGTETGTASWYDHQPGVCAHKSLLFGTVVTVTHTGNGRRTTCTVGDRGPYVEGWIIDLHPEQFSDLAPTSTGVVQVRITW